MISIAGEGPTDLIVMRRLLLEIGIVEAVPYWGEGRRTGKQGMTDKLAGWSRAAIHAPWFVLRDLDHDADCAAALRRSLVPDAPPGFCFRIAVRQTESWLIADRHRLADCLGVRLALVPEQPDALDNPKSSLLGVARRSKRRIAKDMLPRDGSGRIVGPGYLPFIEDFARQVWVPAEAQAQSDSLRRTRTALRRLDV